MPFSKKYQTYWIFVTLYNFSIHFYTYLLYIEVICVANVRKNELTDFGKQVKNILSEKKITQSQLGKTLGIAQNSLFTRLSRYEIGYDKMLYLFQDFICICHFSGS